MTVGKAQVTQGGPSPDRLVEDGQETEQQAGKGYAQPYCVEGGGGLEGLLEYAKSHFAQFLGVPDFQSRKGKT